MKKKAERGNGNRVFEYHGVGLTDRFFCLM